MKRTLIFLIVLYAANIEFAFADFPHYKGCPTITSVAEPTGSSAYRNGFTTYSSRSNDEPYPATKFIGADVDNTYTFSCYYEVSDGTGVTAKFSLSKCSVSAGFDSSGKCNNSDPKQCMVVCSY